MAAFDACTSAAAAAAIVVVLFVDTICRTNKSHKVGKGNIHRTAFQLSANFKTVINLNSRRQGPSISGQYRGVNKKGSKKLFPVQKKKIQQKI